MVLRKDIMFEHGINLLLAAIPTFFYILFCAVHSIDVRMRHWDKGLA